MTDQKMPQDLIDAGWATTADGKSIRRSYKFRNFREALAWMVRAGFEAEAMNHHPDWSNSYNRVEVSLTTHDAGGLTEKDVELARRLGKITNG